MGAKRTAASGTPAPLNIRLDETDIVALDAWVEEIRRTSFGYTVTRSSLARDILRKAIAEHSASTLVSA